MKSITLTMIARNESRTIARALDSARPYVDRMVVLDTGSLDETQDIAMLCGAEVHYGDWTENFSEARNRLFDLVQDDWHLVLDADECIDPRTKIEDLRRFTEGENALGMACICTEVQTIDGQQRTHQWMPRLLPGHVRYDGRIHEQPASRLPMAKARLMIRHDPVRDDNLRIKHEVHLQMLMRELAAHPRNPVLLFHKGLDHDAAGEWDLACDAYMASVSAGGHDHPFAHELSVRLLHALVQAGRHAEALQWAQQLERTWPQSSDVFFAVGNLCLDLAAVEPSRALDTWLPSAEAAWQRCLEIGEGSCDSGHVLGRGSFLAAKNLSVLYSSLGQPGTAEQYGELERQQRELLLAA